MRMTDERFKHFTAIYKELQKAEAKHPKFCDVMSENSLDTNLHVERTIRQLNDDSEVAAADMILYEEIAEAVAAYAQGDYEHCMQELGQCGAVVMRMMEWVEKKCQKAIPEPSRDTK